MTHTSLKGEISIAINIVMRIVGAYGPQSERPDTEKVSFYDEMASEWDLESSSQIIVF